MRIETRRMSTSSFGPRADAYAARLPAQLNVLAFDEIGFAEALEAAFEWAYHRGPFLTAPIISDRRATVAHDAAREIVSTYSAYWKRRQCLDLVREQRFEFDELSQAAREALTKKERDSIGDVLLAADGVVYRSWAEMRRLSELLDFRPVRSRLLVAPTAYPIPGFAPQRGAKSIVVWAPELDALRASIFALAFEEIKTPVIIACADPAGGAALGLRASFVAWNDSVEMEPLLREAAAIIDASPDDPAAAIALAGLGLPLAAACSSGSYEYVDGLYLYDSWDYRSILHAGLAALGGELPVVRATIPWPQDLIDDPVRLEPPESQDPPLVTVVMMTYNRHGVLPRAIDSVARQTYPNVDVVIVNDGGEPIDSIVERLPRKLLINLERVSGRIGLEAFQAGFDAATGTYVVFLSDDDYLFPTHISRLVYALERTGETVAVGMCAESYLTQGKDGSYDFIGTSIRPYRSTDPTILQTVPTSIAISAMVVRRDAAIAAGGLNAQATGYADYEWHLRFLDHYTFLWISQLVLNMDTRLDLSNMSGTVSAGDRAAGLHLTWALHACRERPDIEAARQTYIELLRSAAPSNAYPLYRGVTRVQHPKSAVYRLH